VNLRVVIFGATSAIAADVARVYAARGARLVLVGRNQEKLGALARELADAVVAQRVQDFDRTEQAEACVAWAVEQFGGAVDRALIAHGLLGDQLESERSVALAEQIARTNYLSVMALLVPLANHFEAHARAVGSARGKSIVGRLAVLSTVAAERGRPRNYTYAAAKAALNVYLQGLRSRLYPSGVSVHTIKLGPVDTPMTVAHHKNALFARSSEVARGIVAAVEGGRSEAYVPRFWQLIMLGVRNMPEAVFQRFSSLSGR
jgi:decaprenylphospho-beta-D-erythro-pentofuranosid-2-ulose 2-reductase